MDVFLCVFFCYLAGKRKAIFLLFIFLSTLFIYIVLQVDTHIQQLDQYLKNFDEKLRHGSTCDSTFDILYAPVNMEHKYIYLFHFGSNSHLLYHGYLQKEGVLLQVGYQLLVWMVVQNLDGEQKVVEEGVKSKIISYMINVEIIY